MKRSLVGLLALLVTSPILAAPPPPGTGVNRPPPAPTKSHPVRPAPAEDVVVSRAEFDRTLERLERELAALRKQVQRKNQDDTARMIRDVQSLRRELAKAPRIDTRGPPDRRGDDRRPHDRDPRHALQIVSPQELQEVRSAVARQSFGKDKVRILSEASRTRYYDVSQVIQLLSAFTFDSDRVEALKVVVPRTVDAQHNGFRILEQFRFDSDRQKAQQVLATAEF